jgi:hypothetical protein
VTIDEELAHLERLLARYGQSAGLRRDGTTRHEADRAESEISKPERQSARHGAPILVRQSVRAAG